jgi:uncharacterized protein YcnI
MSSKTRIVSCAATVLALGMSGTLACAHPTLQIGEAHAGAPYRASLAVPHGCAGSATVKLRVMMPEGFIGAKPMPKPGWTTQIVRGPYAHAYEFMHGQKLSEGVKEVSWSGSLPDAFYDEFVIAGFFAKTLKAGSAVYFPTYQDCEKGSTAWTEIPAAGQSAHDLAHPAPSVMLLAVADKMAMGKTYKAGALVIEGPWARATPGGARVGGGYVKITNTGKAPDRLIGGSLPIAGSVEVHEMAMSGDVMKMRQLEHGLEIKPGQTVELKPGGSHLMFMNLTGGLKAGETVKGTLKFEKAGTVEVEFRVAPIGAQSATGSMHHMHH